MTTTTHHNNILVKNQLHTPFVVPKLRTPGEKSLAMRHGLNFKLEMAPLANIIPQLFFICKSTTVVASQIMVLEKLLMSSTQEEEVSGSSLSRSSGSEPGNS